MPPKKDPKKKQLVQATTTTPKELAEGERLAKIYDSVRDKFEQTLEQSYYLKVSPEKATAIHNATSLIQTLETLHNIVIASFHHKEMGKGFALVTTLHIKILSLKANMQYFVYCNSSEKLPGLRQKLILTLQAIKRFYEDKHHIGFIHQDEATEKYLYLALQTLLEIQIQDPESTYSVTENTIATLKIFIERVENNDLALQAWIYLIKVLTEQNKTTKEYCSALEARQKSLDKAEVGEPKPANPLFHYFLRIFQSWNNHPHTQSSNVVVALKLYDTWSSIDRTGAIEALRTFQQTIQKNSLQPKDFFHTTILSDETIEKYFIKISCEDYQKIIEQLERASQEFPHIKILEALKTTATSKTQQMIHSTDGFYEAITSKEWQNHLVILKAKEKLLTHFLQLMDLVPRDTLATTIRQNRVQRSCDATELENTKKEITFFQQIEGSLTQLQQEKIKKFDKYLEQLRKETEARENYLEFKRKIRRKVSPSFSVTRTQTRSSTENTNTRTVFFQSTPQPPALTLQNRNMSAQHQSLLNQAFKKITEKSLEEAIKLYETLISSNKSDETTIFALIHASWGIADCKKIQAKHPENSRQKRRKSKQQAQAKYQETLVYVSQAMAMFANDKECRVELDTYAELIQEEIDGNRQKLHATIVATHKNFHAENKYPQKTTNTKAPTTTEKPAEIVTPSAPDTPSSAENKPHDAITRKKPTRPVIQDDGAKKIIEQLADAKLIVRVVGGAVRDYELNRKPKDYDLVVSTTIEKTIEILNKLNIKFELLGNTYPIIRIQLPNTSIEISCLEGFNRRHCYDCTVNSGYYDVISDTIVFHKQAEADLKEGIITTFDGDNDEERFIRDPVLFFRAIYCSNKLNFPIARKVRKEFSIYPDLLLALDTHTKHRIFTAVMKLFDGGFAVAAVQTLQKYPNLIMRDQPNFYMLELLAKEIDKGKTVSLSLLTATLLWQPLQEALATQQNTPDKIMDYVIQNSDFGIPLDPIPAMAKKIWLICLEQQNDCDAETYFDAKKLLEMNQVALAKFPGATTTRTQQNSGLAFKY